MSSRYETEGSKSSRSKFSHESLLKHDFFAGRSQDFLDQVTCLLSVEVFGPGDAIVKQGDAGDRMYFLNHGEVEVFVGDVKVTAIKEGSIFGDLAVFGSRKRTATVKAKGFCDCRSIDQRRFHRILKIFPKDQKFFGKVAEDIEANMRQKLDAALGQDVGSLPAMEHLPSGGSGKGRAGFKASAAFRSKARSMTVLNVSSKKARSTERFRSERLEADLPAPRETPIFKSFGSARHTCDTMCRETSCDFSDESPKASNDPPLPDLFERRLDSENADLFSSAFDERAVSSSLPLTSGARVKITRLRSQFASNGASDVESCCAPPICVDAVAPLHYVEPLKLPDAPADTPALRPLPFIKSKSTPVPSMRLDVLSDDGPTAKNSDVIGFDTTDDASDAPPDADFGGPDLPEMPLKHLERQQLPESSVPASPRTMLSVAGASPALAANFLRVPGASACVAPRALTMPLTNADADLSEGATLRTPRRDLSPKFSERWTFSEQSGLRSRLVFDAATGGVLAQPQDDRGTGPIDPFGEAGRLASVYRSLRGPRQVAPQSRGASLPMARQSRGGSAAQCKGSRRGAAMRSIGAAIGELPAHAGARQPARQRPLPIELNVLEMAAHQWSGPAALHA